MYSLPLAAGTWATGVAWTPVLSYWLQTHPAADSLSIMSLILWKPIGLMAWIWIGNIPMHIRIPGKASLPQSEEHTSELQSRENLVCRLLLEKKKSFKH